MIENSIYTAFLKVTKDNSNRIALRIKKNGQWKSLKYKNLLKYVNNVARNLSKKGISDQDRVLILSENRPEWLISDLALNKLGAISVPIHTTAADDMVQHIIKDSKAGFLIVSQTYFKKFYSVIRDEKDIKSIFIMDYKKIIKKRSKNEKFIINKKLKRKIIDFKKLLKEYKHNPRVFSKEKNHLSKKIASIVYTSGTTGDPKGAMLSNKNFLSNVKNVNKRVKILKTDLFYSFLPLSHVLERTAGSFVPILSGASIAYSTDVKLAKDEIREVKPTVLICVPKIFERIFDTILKEINEGSKMKKKIFFWSLKKNKKFLEKFLAEFFIFRKLRKLTLERRLRFAVSGGANISENIIKFFNDIGINIIEGYGLTETSPIISVNSLDNKKNGTVGQPIKGVQVEIAKDKEILVKGDNVFQGYWCKKEQTKDSFNKEGWYKTGDLGFIDNENFLKIIGRKKEIIVTSNGKNIAPNKIEAKLDLIPLVNHSIVIGNGKKYLAALIEIRGGYDEKLKYKFNQYKDQIKKEIAKINKKLAPYEQIREVGFFKKPLTIEDKELTPTLKIRRSIIEKKYQKLIDDIYR